MTKEKNLTRAVIKKIGVFGNPGKEGLQEALSCIESRCSEAGVEVIGSVDLQENLPSGYSILPNREMVEASDLIIALGGDGTMLRAARILGLSGVPLLGVNLGSLGYLTDVPLSEADTAMERLLKGDFLIDARARVYVNIWRGEKMVANCSALNDLVVNMGILPRALDMELNMDGDSLGRFLGDGIIVSTPTGSTAYNLSAGGPICHSSVQCLLVAPICPHSLNMRPLIISKDTRIELIIHQSSEGAVLTADGQKTHMLVDNDRLVFKEADHEVNLVKFPNSNFYRVMRHKLNWGGSQRRLKKRP